MGSWDKHVVLVDTILGGFEPGWFFAAGVLLLLLGLVGLYPVRLEADIGSHGTTAVYVRRALLVGLGLLLILGAGVLVLAWVRLGGGLARQLYGDWARAWLPFLGAALVFGMMVRLGLQRYVFPRVSTLLRSWRVVQDTERASDIREELDAYRPLDFTPSDFYRDGQVFVGLGMDGRPVYEPLDDWRQMNKATVGATRFGKGVTWQAWMEQDVRRGDTVVLVDPKADAWLPLVLRQAAEAGGRRFISLDLTDPASPGRYAPFAGGSPADRRARFYDVMDLVERGTDADHYKALAREQLFDLFTAGRETGLAELLHAVQEASRQDEDTAKALSTIRARLKEWASYDKLCPKPGRGFNVDQTLRNGAVVYVRGSLDDQVVLGATRALLMEVVQEARALKASRPAPLVLYVDELRFLASETICKALATVVGFNATVCTAFQNFGDLLAPADARLDGQSVLQAVRVNSQLKVVFGGTDPDTAEWVAEATGTRNKRVARFERTEVNRSGGETWANQRTLADLEEHLVPMNVVLALPPRVAVLLRPRALAQVVTVSPVRVLPAQAGGEAAGAVPPSAAAGRP